MSDHSRVIDLEIFSQLSSLLEEDMPSCIDAYLKSSQEYLEGIEEAIMEQDPVRLKRFSHPLKSSSAQMGAKRLSGLAAILEKCGDEAVVSELGKTLDELRKEIERVRDFLVTELDGQAKS